MGATRAVAGKTRREMPSMAAVGGLCHVPEGRVAFCRRVDIVRHERIIRGLRAVPAPDCGKEPGGQSPEQCATW